MDERLKFVARLLDGEQMSALCREFGISRKTGYKIYNRYKETGLDGLKNKSRRPIRRIRKIKGMLGVAMWYVGSIKEDSRGEFANFIFCFYSGNAVFEICHSQLSQQLVCVQLD